MKKLIPLLLLAVIFTAGCDLAGINLTTTTQSAAINSFGASPPSIASGESSDLSWNVSGATTVNIDQGIGNVALNGSRTVMPGATTVYTLTATNAAGISVTATAQVIVTGASTPSTPPTTGSLSVVNYFTASPTEIYTGGSSLLSWNVSNATSVNIDHGVGTVGSSGSTLVLPATSTTYTLTATNTAGWLSKSATVLVYGAPSPPSFAVTSVTASADPPFFSGACPTTVNFYATIAVNGPGTVTYRWEGSDGGFEPTQSISVLDRSETVSTSWQLGASGSYWARVHVFTPNEIVSNQASFTLSCAGTEILTWTGTGLINSGQNAWGNIISFSQIGNNVTGSYSEHENGTYNGTVSGNVLTGTWSEEPTYLPPNDAGEFQITLSPDGNTFDGVWRYDSSGSWYDWSGQRLIPK
jgi:hypothetical protein